MPELDVLGFQLVNGLIWGAIVALIALGLNAIYGLLGVLNMAHGSLYALGAILAWFCVSWIGNFWVALVVAPTLVALASIPLHWLVLRKSIGKELMVGLLATSGVLFLVDDTSLWLFGGSPRTIFPPIAGSFEILSMHYPVYRVAAAGIAVAVLLLFWVFLQYTRMGVWVRCVAQSAELAKCSGVPVERVYLVIVSLGAFFSAMAGVLAAPMTLVHYQMGFAVLGPAFIVIVVGGLGSMAGAVIAAMIIGIARGVLTVFVPPTYAEVLAIAILLPLLVIRPQGLFGGST